MPNKLKIVTCEHCSLEFESRRNVRFCSRSCVNANSSLKSRVDVACHTCGKIVSRCESALKKSRSGLFFCSRECKGQAQKIKTEFIYNESKPVNKFSGYRTSVSLIECAVCLNNHYHQLIVHHVDGNRKNNDYSNLEVVCANCHINRHLSGSFGSFKYSSAALTDRKIVSLLDELTPKGLHRLPITYCDRCGVVIPNDGSYECKDCKPKRVWIKKFEVSKEDLEYLLDTNNFTEIGEIYGVTSNAIKKRAIKLGIDFVNKRGYWKQKAK